MRFPLRSLAVVSILCFPPVGLAADPAPADQRDYPDSPNGCAPATLLNLLRFGGSEFEPARRGIVGATDAVRMRYLADRYFRNRRSQSDPERFRWGLHGVDCGDFADGIGELLAEHGIAPVQARYLDREDGESDADHLGRVRRLLGSSLDAGVPPILSLRSFQVRRREEDGDEPRWESVFAHYVLVTGLRTGESDSGFEIDAIDPFGGRRTVLYLHPEANGQPFRALKGNERSGIWLGGRPFLQVVAPGVPTLRPARPEWSERYLVVANHLIGRF